jgi:hypothetical protein
MLLNYQARPVQPMQKALTQMNIQRAQVISEVAAERGQKIRCAILAGERDGQALARLKDGRIRASEEDIAKALQGSGRESPSNRQGPWTTPRPSNFPKATAHGKKCWRPFRGPKANRVHRNGVGDGRRTPRGSICGPPCFSGAGWI